VLATALTCTPSDLLADLEARLAHPTRGTR
jgi:hypothetical protein